jgi:long-subunit fatty acid transport protein
MVAQVALVALWLGAAAPAVAGGFEHPTNGTRALGRGGAFTAMANDLTAMDYNPAGLLHNKGWQIMLSNNFTDFKLKFTPTTAAGRINPVENDAGPFLLAPVFGVSTDILHPDVRVALGVYGPSAYGRSTYPVDWDRLDEEPGAFPHRYMLTETDIMLVYYTASVAWQPFDMWGVGLSLHWIDMMQGRIGMVTSGWMDDIQWSPANDSYDVRAQLDVSSHFNFAATLGTWVRPIDRLRIGASFRVGFDEGGSNNIDASGTMKLQFQGDFIQSLYISGKETGEGIVPYSDSGKPVTNIPVTFNMTLPMVARLGIQYIHPFTDEEQLFDIELDVIWEGWSALQKYGVDLSGYMQVTGAGVVKAEKMQFQPVDVPKNFQDTWSVRLGGDVRITKWLQARLGGYYETGAVPVAYTNIDFASFDRLGIGTGLTFHYRWFDLSFGYSHIFQKDRVVSIEDSKVYVQFPLLDQAPLDQHKVNAGKYETSYDIYSLSLEAKF